LLEEEDQFAQQVAFTERVLAVLKTRNYSGRNRGE
jgi:hypothetical protein